MVCFNPSDSKYRHRERKSIIIFVFCYCFLQLEMIIGKLKTEKYGDRILGEVKKYGIAEQLNDNVLEEEQGTEKRPRKKLKTKEEVVVLTESSNDE